MPGKVNMAGTAEVCARRGLRHCVQHSLKADLYTHCRQVRLLTQWPQLTGTAVTGRAGLLWQMADGCVGRQGRASASMVTDLLEVLIKNPLLAGEAAGAVAAADGCSRDGQGRAPVADGAVVLAGKAGPTPICLTDLLGGPHLQPNAGR